MHKILSCPDILDEIFSYSSKHTNTATARVCRIWFTQSIRFIWDKASINDALKLISSSIENRKDKDLSLIPPSLDRFYLYSGYIRHLECFNINHTAFKQLMFWRSSTELFSSRLTVVHWKGWQMHIECLPAILTPILQHLNITLDFIEIPELEALFETIAIHSPSLSIFQFVTTSLMSIVVSESLIELMSCLSQLTIFVLPIYFLTPELFTTLSRLPSLRFLMLFSVNRRIQVVDMEIDTRMIVAEKIELEDPRHFHSLQSLYISEERNRRFTKFLTSGVRFLELVRLDYSLNYKNLNLDQLINVTELVNVICPNLREITLRKASQLKTLRTLPWEAVQPLLKCSYIHTLKFIGFCIDMNQRDIVTVATNRTFWRTVILFPCKPFNYHALISFAQNCPELIELGLELNDVPGLPNLSTFETDVWFPSLKTLYVLRSKVAAPVDVGIFLSHICGNPFTIHDVIGWNKESWNTVQDIVNSRITPWDSDSELETNSQVSYN